MRRSILVLGSLVLAATSYSVFLYAITENLYTFNAAAAAAAAGFEGVDTIRASKNPQKAHLPPICSDEQLATMLYQLPAEMCENKNKSPWTNECSFSYATRCPDAVWLTDYYTNMGKGLVSKEDRPRNAIYVGCNKGMDAINTLRMMSSNPGVDKHTWKTAFFDGQTVIAGHCKQELVEQFSISDTEQTPTIVHCIEAMPVTAHQLAATAEKLNLNNELIVQNAAMSSSDGTAWFPDMEGKVGVETAGLDNCAKDKNMCKEIPQYTLDTYVGKFIANDGLIDFLSIDVEGFDWEVILGAGDVLTRVRYLEFEYNWKGPWGKHLLSTAILKLQRKGFICYWAGTDSHIWRITGCWLDHFDLKFWSNVACVHHEHDAVADRMEELFMKTLAKGRTVRYHNRSTVNSD